MGVQAALIVVAEDEAITRMAIVDALIAEGFEVIETTHATEAISRLQTRAHDVHVLFTDVHMPGKMDGVELAHYVRSQWPHIGVILTSGQAAVEPHELPHGSRFVPKPYQTEHVVSHVRELIASAA